jgi:hypothetical protein
MNLYEQEDTWQYTINSIEEEKGIFLSAHINIIVTVSRLIY